MAQSVGSIHYDLSLSTQQFDAQMAAIKGKLDTVGQQISDFGGGMKSLGTNLTIGITAPLLALGAYGVASAKQIQTAQQSMTALTGSSEKASKVIGELYNFVLGKPIKFPDAAQAASTLLGYGRTSEQVIGDMKTLSTLAIVNGADLNQLSLVFGQITSRGALFGQDALQLINNKIPLTTILSKQLGITMEEASKRINGGQISAEQFTKAMTEYAKSLDITAFSNTLENRLISLQGSFRSLAFSLLGIKIDPVKGFVVEAGGLFDMFSKGVAQAAKWASELGKWFRELDGPTKSLVLGFILLLAVLGPILIVVGSLVQAVGAIVGALAAINPVTIAIMAVLVALGAIIYLVASHFNEIRAAAMGLWQVIGPILVPALQYLWGAISGQLIPALQNLWTQLSPILVPAMRLLGGVVLASVVAAIVTLSYVLGTVANVIGWVINTVANFIGWMRNAAASTNNFIGAVWGVVNTLNGLAGSFYNSGAGLINAFARGISAAVGNAVGAVSGVLNRIRNLLPHSDAKEGPLSDLTASGFKLGETFAKGIMASQDTIYSAMSHVLPNPTVNVNGKGAGGNVANITIGTIQDRADADYILSHIDRNYELSNMGVSPAL